MRRVLVVVVLAAALAGLAGCSGGDAEAGDRRLRVVASFYPLAEAAARVGGDEVDVVNLTPAGSEPHDLELTADQLDQIEDADLVVYLGGGFQPALDAAIERSEAAILDVAGAVRLDGAADDRDPHFWLDPTRQADAVAAIEAAMTDAGPDRLAATLATSAGDYRTELGDLDARIAAGLASCERDELVTADAAFGYLAERYGLEQLAITGISPEAEPDPERLADLTDLIGERGATTVFHEPLVSSDLADTLAREAGVESAVLDPIEGLTEEAIDAGASYITVMDENLAALQEALGCR